MAAYTSSGYAVADIAALKAISPADRPASGSGIYALAYVSDVQWYEFDPDAISGGITPDNGTGRWFAIGREVLRTNRTYFVRTDGNDNNDGLTNTSGGAFLTIQNALNAATSLDTSVYDITIQIADGTYSFSDTAFINTLDLIGSGQVIIQGNVATPSNVILGKTFTAGDQRLIFSANTKTVYTIRGVTFSGTKTSGSYSVYVILMAGGRLLIGDLVFGVFTNFSNSIYHIFMSSGVLSPIANYTITGGAYCHIEVRTNAVFTYIGGFGALTVTATGTPSFGIFCVVQINGTFSCFFGTFSFSGSATGKRYEVALNGVIRTLGGGANFFLGNSAGTVDGFGVYN